MNKVELQKAGKEIAKEQEALKLEMLNKLGNIGNLRNIDEVHVEFWTNYDGINVKLVDTDKKYFWSNDVVTIRTKLRDWEENVPVQHSCSYGSGGHQSGVTASEIARFFSTLLEEAANIMDAITEDADYYRDFLNREKALNNKENEIWNKIRAIEDEEKENAFEEEVKPFLENQIKVTEEWMISNFEKRNNDYDTYSPDFFTAYFINTKDGKFRVQIDGWYQQKNEYQTRKVHYKNNNRTSLDATRALIYNNVVFVPTDDMVRIFRSDYGARFENIKEMKKFIKEHTAK